MDEALPSSTGNSSTVPPVDDLVLQSDPLIVYILSSLLTINCLGSVFGNALVLYTFIKEKPLGGPLRIILSNLAASNLSIAAIGEPMVAISGFQMEWAFGDLGRSFEAYIVTACGLTAMSLLACVSIERYTRINPRRMLMFTEPGTIRICSLIWVYNIIYASLPFYGIAAWKSEGIGISNSLSWKTDSKGDMIYVLLMMCTGYFLPLFIISFCYNRILFFVKKAVDVVDRVDESVMPMHPDAKTMETNLASKTSAQATSAQATSQISASTAMNDSTAPMVSAATGSIDVKTGEGVSVDPATGGSAGSGGDNAVSRVKAAERKISHVIAVIIVSFFISWTPYTIINVLVTFDKTHIFAGGIHATVPALLAKTSTLWSPIIYCAMNGEVRTANLRTLKRFRRWVRILYFGGGFNQ